MHMSHKKRASFALKSMGAAGLAAATIVSGLPFGTASATAATAADTTVSGQIVVSPGPGYYFALDGQGDNAAKMTASSTLEGAKRYAPVFELPAPGTSGPIRKPGTETCVTRGTTSAGALAWGSCASALPFNLGTSIAVSPREGTGGYYATNISSTLATYDEIVASINQPLVANLTSTSNIEKSAVISGTATPNQTVTIGSKTVNVNADGKWTMTVTDLANGANPLVAIQKRGTTEIDRKPVSVTIVESGGLFGVDQGPVELERGETTQVPFVVENRVDRTDTKGTVVLTAPDGGTFSEQDTVQGSWRRVGNTAWNASTSIPL
jgi:hypothetical protein